LKKQDFEIEKRVEEKRGMKFYAVWDEIGMRSVEVEHEHETEANADVL
jgi:hypothetical protein